MRTPHVSTLAGILMVATWSAPARATYSIVAGDTRTQQVGGAGASCVYPSQVSVIYGVAPGFGAVHAQAQSNAAGRDRAVQLLRDGQSPSQIITAITSMSFDASAARRQYGVIDVMGRSAGYTGAQNMAFADDRQSTVAGYVYSVQGNILTGASVLDHVATAFEGEGCDLADRLMRALEAGAARGEGDSRCVNADGIAANSAFIQVDMAGMPAGSYLKLSAGSARGDDPLPALRRSFDAWRATHPCSNRPMQDGGMGAVDASSALPDASSILDASLDGSATPRDAAAPDSGLSDATTTPAQGVEAGPGAEPSERDAAGAFPGVLDAASSMEPDGEESQEGGCSLRAGPAQHSGCWFVVIFMALLALTRRVRATTIVHAQLTPDPRFRARAVADRTRLRGTIRKPTG